MRRELLYGVAAIAIAVAYQSQPVAAADHSVNWTGPYIGGHLGAGRSNWSGLWDPSESPPVNFSDALGEAGILGGMQAGANYQLEGEKWGSFVLGAEIDVSAVGGMVTGLRTDHAIFSGDDQSLCHPGAAGTDGTAQCGEQIDWLASVRARLGVAFDEIHVYGTIGPAIAQAMAFVASSSTGQNFDFSDIGYAWGAGVEWMARPHLVVGAEFLQYRFDEAQTVVFEATAGDGDFIQFDDVNVFRVRLSYKF